MDPDQNAVAWRWAAGLMACRTESEAATYIARAAGQMAGAEAARVWIIDHERGYRFAGAWPEERTSPERPPDDVARAIAFAAPCAATADGRHRSRLVIPLLAGPRPFGAVELLEKRRDAGPFAAGDAALLAGLVEIGDEALKSLRATSGRERRQIQAIDRLTRLFDIARSLSSSLDMDRLPALIANRARAAMEAEGAYVWLASPSGDLLSIAGAEGESATTVEGWQLEVGAGLAGTVAASGQALLLEEPEDLPGLEERPDVNAGLRILSAAAAPVISEDGRLLGVVEVVNKSGEGSFDEGELPLLRELAGTAAQAIANARRLDAERRASDLGSLLAVSQELASSLDASKIAFTLVHKAALVIRYKRAAVGLLKGARLELAAVSGQSVVDETQPEIKSLRDLLAWAAGLDEGFYAVQEDDGTIDVARPEAREKFRAWFASTGGRSFLAVPLRDEEGCVGVLTLEAAEPYAFAAHDLEAAELMAVQATVAIRNAVLFQQIPMLRVFEPLARRKRWLLGLSHTRRVGWAAAIALTAAFLLFFPLPLRISGEARVLSIVRLPVSAQVDGRVTQVLVREGDAVETGQVLALMDDTDFRIGEQDARARYQAALIEQNRLRADGQAGGAAVEAARLEGLRAEAELWEARLEHARLRAPMAGIVATPRVEERSGLRLSRGEVFCEVVEPGHQRIEVIVPEEEAGLVGAGMPVKIKLKAYPTQAFRATVERVSVAASVLDDGRVFLVRARLDDTSSALRPGMTGSAKISTGPAPVGRVLLRRPARWLWASIWGWLP